MEDGVGRQEAQELVEALRAQGYAPEPHDAPWAPVAGPVVSARIAPGDPLGDRAMREDGMTVERPGADGRPRVVWMRVPWPA